MQQLILPGKDCEDLIFNNIMEYYGLKCNSVRFLSFL